MKHVVVAAATVLALVLTSLCSGAVFTPSRVAHAAKEPGSTSGTSTVDPSVLTALNTLGDDAFSVADLTAVLPDPGSAQKYGPYPSHSTDAETCGNDWAQGTFDRHFTVRQTGPDMYTVVEQVKDGSVGTNAGASPGDSVIEQFKDGSLRVVAQSQDGSSSIVEQLDGSVGVSMGASPGGCVIDLGGILTAGVMGSMHGYEIITVTGAQMVNDVSCMAGSPAADCTTAGFIQSHFPGGAYSIGTFFFHYSASSA